MNISLYILLNNQKVSKCFTSLWVSQFPQYCFEWQHWDVFFIHWLQKINIHFLFENKKTKPRKFKGLKVSGIVIVAGNEECWSWHIVKFLCVTYRSIPSLTGTERAGSWAQQITLFIISGPMISIQTFSSFSLSGFRNLSAAKYYGCRQLATQWVKLDVREQKLSFCHLLGQPANTLIMIEGINAEHDDLCSELLYAGICMCALPSLTVISLPLYL